jgi:hypothetical protein
VTQRVQSAIRRARGTWRIRDADLRDVTHLLDAGYEPFAVQGTRVFVRQRQRDWSAAVVLVVAALAAIVVVRWLIILLLAWLVVG